MADLNTRDTVISFANLSTNYALPGSGAIVSSLVPKVLDMVLPASARAAYVAAGDDASVQQVITLQDGTSFTITISPTQNSGVHQAILAAHYRNSSQAAGVAVSSQQRFFPLSLSQPQPDGAGANGKLGGGVNILNGIIGVSW